jgi:hypothetical protein
MRLSIFLMVLMSYVNANAQITLDETYANAGFYGASTNWQVLEIIHLEVDGDKFVFRDNSNHIVNFYNLDHSFWKSISTSEATDLNPDYNNANIMYISQHLFDMDDEIEFLYIDDSGGQGFITQVVNEDGTILFTGDNQAPRMFASVPQNQQPIYNTSDGTFMILSGGTSSDGNAYVYTLPGSLPVGFAADMEKMMDLGSAVAYPNPTSNVVRVDYRLPFGAYSGTIRLLDIQGNEVERVLVDSNRDHTMISTTGLAAGVYQYELSTTMGTVPCGKLVVE